MKLKSLIIAGVASLALGGTAQAAILLVDNFDTETQALNYTGFANFDVTAGSVDLIGSPPPFFNFYPGNGRFVDLDGSTGNQNPAGEITTKASYGAGNYTLSFNLGGSTRGDTNTVRVAFGSFSQDITLASNAGFTLQNFAFGTTGGKLSFTNLGRSDNLGLILDNVQLSSAVPEPATWAMMLIGFGGLGMLSMRRRRAMAV
jgi:PEP-CTERM motif